MYFSADKSVYVKILSYLCAHQTYMNMETILRASYLEQLKNFRDKQVIKVITGIRRCGKSTLLNQFQQYLIQEGVRQDQMIAINFEDIDNEPLCEYHAFHQYIKERLHPTRMTYIFCDEIQNVPSFQKAIDSLYVKPNVDIYITGSNAQMLSQELATLLSGRYVEIKMLPLSFKEYVSAMPGKALSECYTDYVRFGSFPYTLALDRQPGLITDYLQSLFSTIVLKDVVARNKIQDPKMLDGVIRYMFDNIGNMASTKSIADTMTSNARKIDTRTVERYLSTLEEAFVLYSASRFDIRGKQHLKTLSKYYGVDPGLRMALLGGRKYDRGRILENIVYLELLHRHKNVFVGKWDNMEVDFVCIEPSGLAYYQVADTTKDDDTLHRELKPLLSIRDFYPKYLLTLDDDPEIDYDGIRKVNVLRWLVS